MIINGKERKFMFTVNTAIEISQMCPDNNLERLEEILSGDDFTKTLPNIARFIVAMNHGYEMAAHFTDPEHEIDVITMDELLNCDFNVIMEVLDNAMSVYKNDSKREVKTEAATTKGKKTKEIQ